MDLLFLCSSLELLHTFGFIFTRALAHIRICPIFWCYSQELWNYYFCFPHPNFGFVILFSSPELLHTASLQKSCTAPPPPPCSCWHEENDQRLVFQSLRHEGKKTLLWRGCTPPHTQAHWSTPPTPFVMWEEALGVDFEFKHKHKYSWMCSDNLCLLPS